MSYFSHFNTFEFSSIRLKRGRYSTVMLARYLISLGLHYSDLNSILLELDFTNQVKAQDLNSGMWCYLFGAYNNIGINACLQHFKVREVLHQSVECVVLDVTTNTEPRLLALVPSCGFSPPEDFSKQVRDKISNGIEAKYRVKLFF